jgi:hypothetical protein
VKLLIIVSLADDALFQIVAISTTRTYSKPTLLACSTTGYNRWSVLPSSKLAAKLIISAGLYVRRDY